jgi:hypothetical protein
MDSKTFDIKYCYNHISKKGKKGKRGKGKKEKRGKGNRRSPGEYQVTSSSINDRTSSTQKEPSQKCGKGWYMPMVCLSHMQVKEKSNEYV